MPMHEVTGGVLLHSGEFVLRQRLITVPVKDKDDFGKLKTDGYGRAIASCRPVRSGDSR